MGAPYPKQQMHSIADTQLTPRQIAAKLAPAATAGPKIGPSPQMDQFARNSAKIVTLAQMRHAQGEGRVRQTGLRFEPA